MVTMVISLAAAKLTPAFEYAPTLKCFLQNVPPGLIRGLTVIVRIHVKEELYFKTMFGFSRHCFYTYDLSLRVFYDSFFKNSKCSFFIWNSK